LLKDATAPSVDNRGRTDVSCVKNERQVIGAAGRAQPAPPKRKAPPVRARLELVARPAPVVSSIWRWPVSEFIK
jgi:hypothetical protein